MSSLKISKLLIVAVQRNLSLRTNYNFKDRPVSLSFMTKINILFKIFFLLLFVIFFSSGESAAQDYSAPELKKFLMEFDRQCKAYGWKDIRLHEISWEFYRTTNRKKPLVFASFGGYKKNCILLLGGVHGDELPTVYVLLRFANYIKDNPELFKDKCIVIAPLVNPDGFFSKPPLRVNANGIDLNRNFPTRDWHLSAWRQWKNKFHGNVRYCPGKKPGSEQETLFQMALIKRFKPQKILTIHSPLGFYDFDGPSSDLDSFERWLEKVSKESKYPLKKFGYLPGSLGNFAGHERKIFTLTLELPSSEPVRGFEYFKKFQPAIVKYFNLQIHGKEPFFKLTNK
jgi:murein peptide amidase A